MIRHNRLLVAFHLAADSVLGICAFIVAYAIRFHTGLVPITKGLPPLSQYLNVVPFIAVLVPLGFHLQGLYRLRRGRSRVDDFFAVFVGSILTVVFGIVTTLYVQTYLATDAAKDAGTFEVSQLVWALFLGVLVWAFMLAVGVSKPTAFIVAAVVACVIFLYVRLYGEDEPRRRRSAP